VQFLSSLTAINACSSLTVRWSNPSTRFLCACFRARARAARPMRSKIVGAGNKMLRDLSQSSRQTDNRRDRKHERANAIVSHRDAHDGFRRAVRIHDKHQTRFQADGPKRRACREREFLHCQELCREISNSKMHSESQSFCVAPSLTDQCQIIGRERVMPDDCGRISRWVEQLSPRLRRTNFVLFHCWPPARPSI
jgi:hypothetical protein